MKQSREREALLRRLREVYAELSSAWRDLGEGEARLSVEEKRRLDLQRFIEANPELPRGM